MQITLKNIQRKKCFSRPVPRTPHTISVILLHAQEKCVFTTVKCQLGVYVFVNYLPFPRNLRTLSCLLVDHRNCYHVLHVSLTLSVSSNDYYTQLRPLHLAVGKYISLSKRLGYANGSRHSQGMKAENLALSALFVLFCPCIC